MNFFLDTALKVSNAYALAAFLGVLILVLAFWSARRHRRAGAVDKQDANLIPLTVKLLFALAALAVLGSLDRCTSNNSLLNFGEMSNVTYESK